MKRGAAEHSNDSKRQKLESGDQDVTRTSITDPKKSMAEAGETSSDTAEPAAGTTEPPTSRHCIVYHMLSPNKACTDGIVSFQLLRHELLKTHSDITVLPVPFCYGINKMEKVLDDVEVSKDDTIHFVDIIPLPQDKAAMEKHGIRIGYVFDHHAYVKDTFDFLKDHGGTVSYEKDICAAKQIFDKFFLSSQSSRLTEQMMAALKDIIIPMLDLIENMRDLLELPQDHEARIQDLLPDVDVHQKKDDLCYILAYILDKMTLTSDKHLTEMVEEIMMAMKREFNEVKVTETEYKMQNYNMIAYVDVKPPPRAETLNTIKQIKANKANVRYFFMIRGIGPVKKNISILPTTMNDDAALVVDQVKAYCKDKGYSITGGGRMRAAAVQVKNENDKDIIDFLSKLTFN